MLGVNVYSDLQLDTIAEHIDFTTSWGKQAFSSGLTNISSTISILKERQLPVMAIKTSPELQTSIQKILHSLKDSINSVEVSIFKNPKSEYETEALSQIFCKPSSFCSFINTKSLLLNTYLNWKTLIMPGLAVIMPLLAIIMPFFILRFFKQTISVGEYIERLKDVLLKQISIPAFLKSRGENDRIGKFLESLFIAFTIGMFINGLWNQVSSALHLRRIMNSIKQSGAAIQTILSSTQTLINHLQSLKLRKQKALKSFINEAIEAIEANTQFKNLDSLTTFGATMKDVTCLEKLKAWIGKLDVYTSLSATSGICFPKFVKKKLLNIYNVYHPALSSKSCVSNNFTNDLGGTILTGPNRGGKSTFCRAVGLAIITAQSWGFAWASSMKLSPFDNIITALEVNGKLGSLSTFESEIEFAKNVIALPSDGMHFVMMDEIFHSTNASDGFTASKLFLEKLYARKNIISLISTHYIQLANHFRKNAKLQMLLANENADGRLSYTYKVVDGVSEKSSVIEILMERGLISIPPSRTV